jgi:WD40-like Beta Propeller Repeat
VNEQRLRESLREAPVPDAAAAQRRGLEMAKAAFAERGAAPERQTGRGAARGVRRRRHGATGRRGLRRRAALAPALAALLAVLVLSPAGAAVRDLIGDVFDQGVPNAEPTLTRIPGGGRLAVNSARGPWVVKPDGSRRLLGDYREATWSPHGLFLAVASGRTLTAVEPDGDPRWSVSAPARVHDPRWSPDGLRIAYMSGNQVRVVNADGSDDRALARPRWPMPPVWSPGGLPELAYVDAERRLIVRDTESGRTLLEAKALPAIDTLAWGGHGTLLEASGGRIRIRQLEARKIASGVRLGPPREFELSGRLIDVDLSPGAGTIAVLRGFGPARRPRAEVDLIDRRSGKLRRLFRTPGHLGEIAWSPDAQRLLISWPQADQWLFMPISGRARAPQAVAGIARTFSPGDRESGPFPRVAGWCCSAP